MEVVKLSDRPGAYRIDRRTALGNPFRMDTEGDRDAVCEGFRVFLWRMHQSGFTSVPRQLAAQIAGERGLSLAFQYNPTAKQIEDAIYFLSLGVVEEIGCHCAPLRCHGDVIVAYLKWRSESDR